MSGIINKSLIATVQTFQGPNVTMAQGYQNIVSKTIINPSKEYYLKGGPLEKEYFFNTVVAEGTPTNWADSASDYYLDLKVAPIGSCITRLIYTGSAVTGAERYIRIAGAEVVGDFAKMHA